MGVYIKDLEIPKKCEHCWFFGYDSARVGYCYLLKGELPIPDGVPQDCPLIEVPKHGRVIDADKELKLLKHRIFMSDMTTTIAVSMYEKWLNNAPTIIEAEE